MNQDRFPFFGAACFRRSAIIFALHFSSGDIREPVTWTFMGFTLSRNAIGDLSCELVGKRNELTERNLLGLVDSRASALACNGRRREEIVKAAIQAPSRCRTDRSLRPLCCVGTAAPS